MGIAEKKQNLMLMVEDADENLTELLIEVAKEYSDKNLWAKYKSFTKEEQQNNELRNALRTFDQHVNVNWPLVHYKSAVRYLQQSEADIAATGGTNWQKYLPPRFQKRIFYPELWSEAEIAEWGKAWVEKEVYGH